MKVDFHCHTTASDGALTPIQLIDLAVEHQVEMLAITDHDTTAGYESVLDYAKQQGIDLVSGVEISCYWQGHTIHIVGLNVDVHHAGLQTGLARIREMRWQRMEAILDKLEQRDHFPVTELRQRVYDSVGDNGVVGRNHIAQILIEQGVVKQTSQAFDRFLKRGRIGYVKSEWPPLEDVVGWILAAGGIAVVAHPKVYQFTSSKLNRLLTDFKAAGGQAMEVVNQPRHCSDIVGMAERAKRFEFAASMGSDFHRPEHTWRGLGWLAPLPENVMPVWTLFN